MSKILFSDFDGTLFFEDGFHQEDIEAIQAFQEEGNKFALCTGRPLGDSYNDLEMFKVVDYSFTFKTSPQDIQQQTTFVVSSVKEAVGIVKEK